MKKIIPLLFTLYLFTACNNPNKEEPENHAVPVTKEKELLNDVANYPDSALLKETLIEYYREKGDYDKALRETMNAIKKDSSNPRWWEIKAIVHYENEDTVRAILSYEKAIAIFPNPKFIMALGSMYAQVKNPKALQLANVLQQDKKIKAEKEALYIKGSYYSNIGEKQKAIAYFDSCLQLDYTYLIAYREKGIALYDLGKYNAALDVLDKAVMLQNNFDEGYYWRGRCLEKLGKKQEAINEYKTALVYNPDYIEVQEELERLEVK